MRNKKRNMYRGYVGLKDDQKTLLIRALTKSGFEAEVNDDLEASTRTE